MSDASLVSRFVVLLAIVVLAGALSAPVESLLLAYVEEQLAEPLRGTGALDANFMVVASVVFLVGGALADSLGSKRTVLVGLIGTGAWASVLLSGPLFGVVSNLIGAGFAFRTVGLRLAWR